MGTDLGKNKILVGKAKNTIPQSKHMKLLHHNVLIRQTKLAEFILEQWYRLSLSSANSVNSHLGQ